MSDHFKSLDESLKRVGYALLIGFILPVWFSVMGTGKLMFVNFSMLGQGDFLLNTALLYPLFMGVLALWFACSEESVLRSVLLLIGGLLAFGVPSGLNSAPTGMGGFGFHPGVGVLLILSVIGMYTGARLVSESSHLSGRLIGGISGILFLALSLLPVTGKLPVFFSVFGFFKLGSMSPAFIVTGIFLVLVFLSYFWVAIIGVVNLGEQSNSQESALTTAKQCLITSAALPAGALVIGLASGAPMMMILTILGKITLLMGGIAGLVSIGSIGLVNQITPKGLTGGELLRMRQPQSIPNTLPNMWEGHNQ